MRTLIIDDERDSLESLSIELNAYCPKIEIIGTYDSPFNGLDAINEMQPELVMIDIEMPKLSGFELLQSLDDINFDLIFITAFDEYAIRAFEFNAIDYLLKPIRKVQLVNSIQKVIDKKNEKLDASHLKALVNNLNLQINQKSFKSIALPTSSGFEFIKIEDIIYAKSESNYTWIYTNHKKKFIISKTLKEFVQMLPLSQFFRAHQSYYVNMNHVFKYIRGDGGYLILNNNVQIPVSRANKKVLLSFLQGFD